MIWVKNDVNQFGFYFLILSFYLYSTRGLRDIFNMKKHPFYLLGINPWPLLISVLILRLILSLVWWFKSNSIIFILYNILLILVIMFIWFRDNIRDSVINGGHLIEVVTGIKYGIVIFIVSEVFFFIGFFLTFINNRFHPDYNIGDYWPPFRFQIINPFEVPLLNTLILLSSGITITASHYFLLNNKYYLISFYLCLTIMLGLYFTRIQILEYVLISFFNLRKYFRIYFLYCNWISWISCNYWIIIFIDYIDTRYKIILYFWTSFWSWSSYLILTFCRCYLSILI